MGPNNRDCGPLDICSPGQRTGQGRRADVRRWSARLALSLVLTLVAACSSSEEPHPLQSAGSDLGAVSVVKEAAATVLITERIEEPPDEIGELRVTPRSIVADQNEKLVLSVQALGTNGQSVDDVKFVWTTVDPRAGSVDAAGGFRAGVRTGMYKDAVSVTGIQNTLRGIRYLAATVNVTIAGRVEPSRLARVDMIPTNPTVLSGQIFRLRAVGYDESGLIIPGVRFVWQVNNRSLGRVNNLGYLTVDSGEAKFADAVTVTAIWEGVTVSGETDVTVLQTPEAEGYLNVQVLPQRFHLDPGDRMRMQAVALNGLGELVTGTELRWSIVDQGAGMVDGAGMFVAGSSPGIYTEAIKVEAVVPAERGIVHAVDFASVVIREPPLIRRIQTVRVRPASVVLGAGERSILFAQALDELGDLLEGTTVSWHVSREGVGEIDDYGTFEATGAPGWYPEALRVNAQQRIDDELITKSASIDVVITGTLTQVQVLPKLATIAPGRTVHFRASGIDENGIGLPGLVLLWSVDDDRIGTVDVFGNFTAGDQPGLYENAIRVRAIQTPSKPR